MSSSQCDHTTSLRNGPNRIDIASCRSEYDAARKDWHSPRFWRRHAAIQRAVNDDIDRRRFSGCLPRLSDECWRAILLGPSQRIFEENDRLEFFGDTLMHAILGQQLYKDIPKGTPGLYTAIKYVLQSNLTFSRLIERLYVPAVGHDIVRILEEKAIGGTSPPRWRTNDEVKALGDMFETAVAVFYVQRGFESLQAWASVIFEPLIAVAEHAYVQFEDQERGTRRDSQRSSRPIHNGASSEYGPSSSTSGRSWQPGPHSTQRRNTMPDIRSSQQRGSLQPLPSYTSQPAQQPKPRIFIDLTLDDTPPSSRASSPNNSTRSTVTPLTATRIVDDDARSEMEVCHLLGVLEVD